MKYFGSVREVSFKLMLVSSLIEFKQFRFFIIQTQNHTRKKTMPEYTQKTIVTVKQSKMLHSCINGCHPRFLCPGTLVENFSFLAHYLGLWGKHIFKGFNITFEDLYRSLGFILQLPDVSLFYKLFIIKLRVDRLNEATCFYYIGK